MKLVDLIKEEEENAGQKWLQKHVISVLTDSNIHYHTEGDLARILSGKYVPGFPSIVINDRGDLTFSGEIDSVRFDMKHGKYESPIKTVSWTDIRINSLSIQNATFDDLDKIPDALKIYFEDCIFNSFKFPDKTFRDNTFIIFVGSCEIKCGLLGLLKIKRLKRVATTSSSDKKLIAALKIITKHLQADSDIIDCQNELIDAGLEEYATL